MSAGPFFYGLADSVAYDPVSWNSVASVRLADGATARMFYDPLGRPDSILDPVGRRTRFLRDRLGRVTHQQVGTGALAPVSRTVYGSGGLVQQTDVYQSDGDQDIQLVAPGTPVQSTINHYDRVGLPDSIVHPGSRTVSGTTGHQARKQWYARRDNWGNPQYETRGNGSVIGRLYDWQGRVTFANHSQVSPVYSWDGERFADEKSLAWYQSLALRTGPQYSVGQIHEYKYDNKGQVVWTNSRDSYAGQLSERRSGYSRRGLLIADTLTLAGKATVIRSFEYNRRGQRTKVADQVQLGGGHQLLDGSATGETRYVYDGATARLDSMVASASSGEIGRVKFSYDRGGGRRSAQSSLAG